MAEERTDEEEVAVTQEWREAMKMQVHNIIVSTLEASENMLDALDQTQTMRNCGSN